MNTQCKLCHSSCEDSHVRHHDLVNRFVEKGVFTHKALWNDIYCISTRTEEAPELPTANWILLHFTPTHRRPFFASAAHMSTDTSRVAVCAFVCVWGREDALQFAALLISWLPWSCDTDWLCWFSSSHIHTVGSSSQEVFLCKWRFKGSDRDRQTRRGLRK